jgi:hypothetical protein
VLIVYLIKDIRWLMIGSGEWFVTYIIVFQRGVLNPPFGKGGFRGIWSFTVKPAATVNSL